MIINIELIDDGILPKSYTDSSELDVFIRDIEFDDSKAFKRAKCYLGFKTSFNENFRGVLVPRSSLTKADWIMQNSPGTIDADYRGEWIMTLTSLGTAEFPYKVGDRVGQIYFEKKIYTHFRVVQDLDETERGDNGFGSTGQ